MAEFFTVLGIIAALTVLCVLFVLSLRGTLTVAYDGEFSLSFRVLFFNIKLLPTREKKKRYRRSMSRRRAKKIRLQMKKREERRRAFKERLFGKKKKEPVEGAEPKKTDEKKPSSDIPVGMLARETIDVLSALTEIVALIVKRFTHHLRIKIARLKVKVATSDPALTAVTYGAASGVINVLLPILREVENLGLPKEKNFELITDFTADTPEFDIVFSFSLRTWHMADIALRSLFGGLSKYVTRKGGVDKTFDSISSLIDTLSHKEEEVNEKN